MLSPGFSVVFADQVGDALGQLGGERGPVVGRGEADLAGEHGGAARLGQFGEEPAADRVERDLGGGGVLDDGYVVHGPSLSPKTKVVQAVFVVGGRPAAVDDLL